MRERGIKTEGKGGGERNGAFSNTGSRAAKAHLYLISAFSPSFLRRHTTTTFFFAAALSLEQESSEKEGGRQVQAAPPAS